MNTWNTLLQAALVGTARPWPAPFVDDGSPDAVSRLLHEAHALAAPGAPGHLLRLAGALALCRRAGWQAPMAAAEPENTMAADETRTLAGPAWANLLSSVLAQGPLRLQLQVLQAMDQAGLCMPPHLLPDLLHLGRSSVVARSGVLPVLGERGRWLASHNPDWAYARGAQESSSSDTHWEHGSLEQRRVVLLAQRAQAPAQARERLAADWASLAGKDRAVLIQTLAVGLSLDDEAFLNTQLSKDRAQDVRSAAADLLAALAGSAYGLRMQARMAALVTVLAAEGGKVGALMNRLRGRAQPPVSVEAPAQAQPDWKSDLIESDLPKYESLGERAWWLYQLTRRSNFAWWTSHTGLAPAALVGMAVASDWAEALLRGWSHALLQQPDAEWAEALLNAGDKKTSYQRWAQPAALLAMLPTARREAWHLHQLDATGKLPAVVSACLAGCAPEAHWGLALSERLVQLLQVQIAQGALLNDYSLRQQLPEVACALHPEALVLWFEVQRSADETASLSEGLNLTAHVLHSRKLLASLISISVT
jgi:hypothetical protein